MQSPVPTLARALRALDGVLARAEAHCAERKIDEAALLMDRLYPDMLPFWRQVTVACDHAKGAAGRLGQAEVPPMEDTESSFAELRARVARTLAFVESVPEAGFAGAEGRDVTLRLGPGREMTLSGADYLAGFALPNLYFHAATAYNILRHRGVALGKRDFLGA